MSMIQLDLQQGSEEWLDSRLKQFNASEAPVMMGCHPNMRRDELLEAKATCNPKEYSRFVVEKIFDKGHETEAMARPLLEDAIGEDLYPVSGKNGRYQASFDGLTLMQDTGFEHKQWQVALAEAVDAGDPPAYIYWQLEHQLLVCPDLEQIILVVSDGTADNWRQMEYRAVPGRREKLIAGWEQFERDMAEFKPTEKVAEVVGTRPDSLPALFVDVVGQLTTSSNLADYRAGAERLISSIKTDLQTDADFADAEAAVKWLAEGEKKIDSAIEQAMSRTGPLEELVRTLKDIQQNLMRTKRLQLSKQVEAQKVNRRNQIVATAEAEFGNFLDRTNGEFKLVRVSIGNVRPDFYLAIKGKRSFDMMVSACNDLIAQSKIAVNEVAARYRSNLALIAEQTEHDFLFSGDRQTLVDMSADHLSLTIDRRIAHYREKQAADETARKQKHQNTIAGIEAAGEDIDGMPLQALLTTRSRIQGMDTGALQEFAAKGEQVRMATLEKLGARITVLQEQIAREAAAAATPAPVPVAEQAPVAVVAPAPVREAAVPIKTTSKPSRPSDREIIDVLTHHFRVHDSVVLGWLLDFDHEAAGNDLAVNF